ncbi:hypothetical protein QBC40DRAFT_260137 [Triangularia verruculosa]|uniref:Uncharacterized protein n=1 Tax=Triangularia verruculosa TaxID=2587418 RepID=A0AAN7APH1_9PEZI|nr:hypothetical protein QBC40DRAFT_260137 [Triangularia verruculosa]
MFGVARKRGRWSGTVSGASKYEVFCVATTSLSLFNPPKEKEGRDRAAKFDPILSVPADVPATCRSQLVSARNYLTLALAIVWHMAIF